MKHDHDVKIAFTTPTPGKVTKRILQWKYDLLRKAIRKVVPRNQNGLPLAGLLKQIAFSLIRLVTSTKQ
jgi:hypothetical protein